MLQASTGRLSLTWWEASGSWSCDWAHNLTPFRRCCPLPTSQIRNHFRMSPIPSRTTPSFFSFSNCSTSLIHRYSTNPDIGRVRETELQSSNWTGSGSARWCEQVVVDWPHQSRCSRSFVAASAVAAAVSWAWRTSAPPGCLGWTSRTAIKKPLVLKTTLKWDLSHKVQWSFSQGLKKNRYSKDSKQYL